ncbi:uncharacterized protein EV422DRAFT_570184 [Fimicolochytrium jonesii]|uniref:uncharacterized protein n=1 Tax=Fimicolochytrium jonesii TaxID=1396493 RepID=UPI0022FF1BAB|nr:uncharacterized protein EV422DRAFT_570184 [Fimicolochytrium jonesii]KAI8818040.1 hypothetical protein EV422DRAFT_570184 [Fimicolochytrium jonesii]
MLSHLADQGDAILLAPPSTPTAPSPPHLHRLPFGIDHTGPATVSRFFVVADERSQKPGDNTAQGDKGRPMVSSTFRGRRLLGVRMDVPDGYEGRIYKDAPPPPGRRDYTRAKQISATFDRFTAWVHDETPGVANCDAVRALAWLEMAEDIHAHIQPL